MAEIIKIAELCRQAVFTYRDTLVEKGVSGLLQRSYGGGHTPTVRGAVAQEFVEKLEKGDFRQARDAQKWIEKRTRRRLSESGVRKILHRWGGKLKVPRKSHTKKDPAKSSAFKAELGQKIASLTREMEQSRVRIWVMDEHRYGLLPVIRCCWARRGVRVHAPYFLRQIAQSDAHSTHVVIMDQAGFHMQDKDNRVPQNIRLLPLPPYSPELNPAEWFGRVLKAPTINRLYPNLQA